MTALSVARLHRIIDGRFFRGNLSCQQAALLPEPRRTQRFRPANQDEMFNYDDRRDDTFCVVSSAPRCAA